MDIIYSGEMVMNVIDVKTDIRNKTIKKYYVFTGEEIEVMNAFIRKIAEVENAGICRADTLSSIFSKMQNRSIISTKTCFVIRDDKEYMSSEDVWEKLENEKLQNNNLVILLYTDIDKRSKFYKHSKDIIVEFNALTDENLKREIQKRIKLSDKNCEQLIDICDHSLGIILNEIDKIKTYVNYLGPAETQDGVFDKFVKEGTIHQPPRDVIWEFVDAVLLRQRKKAFELMQEALEYGNPILTLISVLYKDTKALLQLQSCKSDDVSKSTGLSGWDIKRSKPRCGRYSISELVNAMYLIRNTEKGIKSGSIDEDVAMEYILVNMM